MESREAQDRIKWQELYVSGARPDRPPSAWVVGTVASLPNDSPLLDVAGGSGRHAIPAARAGHRVVLVDFIAGAVARGIARGVDPVVADVARMPVRDRSCGTVLVTNFLDRAAFPSLIELIAPGGYLVYETYTVDHLRLVERGLARGPQSARFLLRPGELRRLVEGLTILEYSEGEVEDEAGRRVCARLLGQQERGKRKEP